MKRGFPRPQMKVKTITTNSVRNSGEVEKWENRVYPMPYTARRDQINRLHYGRVKECIIFGKCIACGEQVKPDDEGKVFAYLDNGALTPDSGPFHEKCVRLTQTLCPVVKMQARRFTFAKVDWPSLRVTTRRKFGYAYGSEVDEPGT